MSKTSKKPSPQVLVESQAEKAVDKLLRSAFTPLPAGQRQDWPNVADESIGKKANIHSNVAHLQPHLFKTGIEGASSEGQQPVEADDTVPGLESDLPTLTIPLELIDDNPVPPRHYYTEEDLQDLAKSLALNGLITPINVYKDGDRYVLIEGKHRTMAAHRLGWHGISAHVHPKPPTPLALYLLSRSCNVDRAAQSPLDDAIAWKALIDKGIVKDQQTLLEVLTTRSTLKQGLDHTKLSRILGLNILPGSVKQACVSRGQTDLRFLNAARMYFETHIQLSLADPNLATLTQEERAANAEKSLLRIFERYPPKSADERNKLTAKKLEAMVTRIKNPERPLRSEPARSEIRLNESVALVFKEFPDGRLLIEGEGLTEEQFEAIRKALQPLDVRTGE